MTKGRVTFQTLQVLIIPARPVTDCFPNLDIYQRHWRQVRFIAHMERISFKRTHGDCLNVMNLISHRVRDSSALAMTIMKHHALSRRQLLLDRTLTFPLFCTQITSSVTDELVGEIQCVNLCRISLWNKKRDHVPVDHIVKFRLG